MFKKSYITQLTYDVTDAEKMEAVRALEFFDHADKLLNMACDHLNIMKTPFKNNPEMDPKEVMKVRAALRRFRDKAIENFNEFKYAAFKCVQIMRHFSSDTQTIKMVKSFITSIDDLEVKVNKFSELFNDFEAKDFASNAVSTIEAIQEQCEDVADLITERIKKHIQQNILANSWVDTVGDELHLKIEPKTPLILDLFNKRQDQLNDAVRERGFLGN